MDLIKAKIVDIHPEDCWWEMRLNFIGKTILIDNDDWEHEYEAGFQNPEGMLEKQRRVFYAAKVELLP